MLHSLTNTRRKLARQFKALDHFKEQGWHYPLAAEIDLTWRCALNCKGCHSKWMHKDIELSFRELDKILGELKSHGCKSVTWSGGGEPLESPIWEDAVLLADTIGFDQGVYTYFPNPTGEKVSFMDCFVSFVYSHPFNTRGIRRQKTEKDTVWTVGYLLDKDNWMKVPGYIEKTDFNFFDFIDFRPLCPINHPDAKMLDYSWVHECMELLEEESLKNEKIKYTDYKFDDLLKPNYGRNYGECLSTDFWAVVGPNGDMYQCINRRNVTVIGNLLKESLEDIWKRKIHKWTDFNGCRILCRNHEDNKELVYLLGPALKHETFL